VAAEWSKPGRDDGRDQPPGTASVLRPPTHRCQLSGHAGSAGSADDWYQPPRRPGKPPNHHLTSTDRQMVKGGRPSTCRRDGLARRRAGRPAEPGTAWPTSTRGGWALTSELVNQACRESRTPARARFAEGSAGLVAVGQRRHGCRLGQVTCRRSPCSVFSCGSRSSWGSSAVGGWVWGPLAQFDFWACQWLCRPSARCPRRQAPQHGRGPRQFLFGHAAREQGHHLAPQCCLREDRERTTPVRHRYLFPTCFDHVSDPRRHHRQSRARAGRSREVRENGCRQACLLRIQSRRWQT
jgi:hypothetical protein